MNNIYCRVKGVVTGTPVLEGAGVKINRLIGSAQLDTIDPFVLLDEFKSSNPDDYIAGFPTHPHRGIETITYMISGSFRHKDSKGNEGVLTDGCVQWMTAGRGILHSEMPEKSEGLLWGYQLWLSLPAKDKMVPPQYQHLSPELIPRVEEKGIAVNIISGLYKENHGPATNWVKTDYFDVNLKKESVFSYVVENNVNSFCYIHSGSVAIGPPSDATTIRQGELAELQNGTLVEIKALTDQAGFLFLSALPNNEPIVKGGPFVMNSREEIHQAFQDYQNGTLYT